MASWSQKGFDLRGQLLSWERFPLGDIRARFRRIAQKNSKQMSDVTLVIGHLILSIFHLPHPPGLCHAPSGGADGCHSDVTRMSPFMK